MNQHQKPLLWMIAAFLLAMGSIFIVDMARSKQETSLVSVGGKKNQCSCTQRIER